ncbi:hypothetical protein BV898_05983 [Hypsibius exemplaris]|uniref:G-protein coupled receptors family 1 profile domain-containing protein n=1 Tax=Hypsibius exemplaris TaxID=2072580 RepID=A0A1W0WXP3_HYPEX|nr:hypothetical protein BV898_05983 [Hypsibius exemplaris]
MVRVASLHPAILYTQGSLTILAKLILSVTFYTTKKLHTSSNILLISNSVADSLVGLYLMCVPLFPTQIQRNSMNSCLPVRHEICLLLSSLGPHLYSASMAHWAAIAVERYLRIFHTELHKMYARRLLLPAILMCWLLPGLYIYGIRCLPILVKAYPYDQVGRDGGMAQQI